ncbi:LysM peptidoglycan-binding domain-containing protein [Aliivibrio fischeri]|uniref:LysM peptidoglycan-binding domain-containing protein n=1 Tax=Aliivibrio fischeri TaxID=668 RepID=UPI0007C48775|nr:LysM peptidoglycan-binding domain-containing protein [Aliivibrio fischeri]
MFTPKKFIRANYAPVKDGFLTPEEMNKIHYEPIKEKNEPEPEYEYTIEIACSLNELNTYQIGHFYIEKTANEENITTWKKSESHSTNSTLLTTKIKVDEPKVLHREFFTSCGSSYSFVKSKPNKKGKNKEIHSFIPIKPAIQVDKRLGWPTKGFFYHFVNNELVNEYLIVGNNNWSFKVTQSTSIKLSSDLVSEHQYAYILLHWKLDHEIVTCQHILYREEKLTDDIFKNISSEWLNNNAYSIDIHKVANSKNESFITREVKSGNTVTYTVQPNDTLEKIAEMQGITTYELINLNQQYSDKNQKANIGDILIIEKDENHIEPFMHTVQVSYKTNQRETWEEVAKKYNLSAKELLEINPIYKENPLLLQVGAKLYIDNSHTKESKQLTKRKTLPPVDVTKEKTVFIWANLWSEPDTLMLNSNVIALHEIDNIPKKTPILNIRPVISAIPESSTTIRRGNIGIGYEIKVKHLRLDQLQPIPPKRINAKGISEIIKNDRFSTRIIFSKSKNEISIKRIKETLTKWSNKSEKILNNFQKIITSQEVSENLKSALTRNLAYSNTMNKMLNDPTQGELYFSVTSLISEQDNSLTILLATEYKGDMTLDLSISNPDNLVASYMKTSGAIKGAGAENRNRTIENFKKRNPKGKIMSIPESEIAKRDLKRLGFKESKK